MSENETGKLDLNRRDFVKTASLSSIMLMMGGVPLQAEDKPAQPADTGFSTIGAPVSCAVIGCGVWGREVLETLATLPNAPVVAVCDNYPNSLKRASGIATKAEAFDDYKKLLELKTVDAVIVATPTHLHREIVEAALKAGKHVYCEVPLAHTIDDARAIAKAAQEAVKVNFQAGLQMRSDPAKLYILKFIRGGAVGDPVMGRGQWHKRQTWRLPSPNPAREKAANWRLDKEVSIGLVGELGIQQLDLNNWFINRLPNAATGFGSIQNPDCNDGREIPDTVQAVLQYPGKFNFTFDGTFASSFDSDYSMLLGNYATIMLRDKAWLFQEPDSPLLGWEIYASKTSIFRETGITLAATGSKSVQVAHVAASPYSETALHFALASFVFNSRLTGTGAKDFFATYGDDADGLKEYITGIAKSRLPAATAKDGFTATVMAIKANEAVMKEEKVSIPKSLYEI